MAEDGRKLSTVGDFDGEVVEEEEEQPAPPQTLREKINDYIERNSEKANFYATVFFSLVAIGAFFAFLFLVPFVIEPAVTTIQMDFALKPVTCCVVDYREMFGNKNCSDWNSCKEGCTRRAFECVKILVAYTDAENFTCSQRPANHQWLHNEAKLFPNVKGCGYPPSLNCTLFNAEHQKINTTFPCYYSRVDATLVITTLNPEQMETDLTISIVVPFVCFILSILFLLHAYRRMKRRDAAAAVLAEQEAAAACLAEGDELDPTSSRSNPNSSYSLKSITSKINSTVVRFTRDRRHDSG